MRSLLLLSLLLGENAQARPTRYYHYDNKPLALTDRTFKRYGIPQARTMLREYYDILRNMDPGSGEVFQARVLVEEIYTLWKKSEKRCREEPEKECVASRRELYAKGRQLDQVILQAQKKKTDFSPAKKEGDISYRVNLLRELDKLGGLNFRILHYLEIALIGGNGTPETLSKMDVRLAPLFHELRSTTQAMVLTHLPDPTRELFDFIWIHFFKRLQRHIIADKDKSYLLRHLGELNTAWNTFNMRLTKGPQKYPNWVETLVQTMHNRWNSILKLILLT